MTVRPMRWPHQFAPLFARSDLADGEPVNFAFIGEDLILTTDHQFPGLAALRELATPRADFLVGELGGAPCRASLLPADTVLPAGLQAISLRFLHGLLPEGYWAIAARAKQMLNWDLASRYCGACGTPTEFSTGEPAKLCPTCGQRDFPRIAPAVIVVVRRGAELLLARSPHFRPGMYSALAGFMEAGESVEECLRREVFEEVGIHIARLRWFDSQTWPFPHSLMLAFHADYAGGEISPQPGEIEDAGWFSLDRLPDLPYPVSIAHRLINAAVAEIRHDASAPRIPIQD